MTVCAIKSCENSSRKTCMNITFHKIPTDPVTAKRWIDIIRKNRNEFWWKPKARTLICSAHFDENDIYTTKTGRRRIILGAVPKMGNSASETIEQLADTKIKVELQEISSDFDTQRNAELQSYPKKKCEYQEVLKKEIKRLRQKNLRLEKRNSHLKQLLKTLKTQKIINNDLNSMSDGNPFAADLFNNLRAKNGENKKRLKPFYTKEYRKFCLTLNFYSPKAYTYVRSKFNTFLPHPKTLARWYHNRNGDP